MNTKYVSPFKDGATIQVAYGVLRGVGPMGPRGLSGPQGLTGPQGPPGPQAEMLPVTAQFNTAAATNITANASWVPLAMVSTAYSVGQIGSITSGGGVTMTGVGSSGIAALITPQITVVSNATTTTPFNFEVGLFLGTSGVPFASTTFQHSQGTTANTYSFTAQMLVPENATVFVKVRTWATAVPQVTTGMLAVSRAGGPTGVQGPVGSTGPTGLTGPVGPAGNSGSGYSTMDAMDSVGDSDALPAGSSTTAQGIPYPLGTQRPALPAFLKANADATSKWIIRRFTNSTDILPATDVAPGQIAYVSSTASWQGVAQISGTNRVGIIAQVLWGVSDPPAGTHPGGTIYLKVTA